MPFIIGRYQLEYWANELQDRITASFCKRSRPIYKLTLSYVR